MREYEDNETQQLSKKLRPQGNNFDVGTFGGSNEDLLHESETHESLPVGPLDKLPFGMNIKKAAY